MTAFPPGRLTPSLKVAEKFRNGDSESFGNGYQGIQARDALGTFEQADCGSMQATAVRKLFLRPMSFFTEVTDSFTQRYQCTLHPGENGSKARERLLTVRRQTDRLYSKVPRSTRRQATPKYSR